MAFIAFLYFIVGACAGAFLNGVGRIVTFVVAVLLGFFYSTMMPSTEEKALLWFVFLPMFLIVHAVGIGIGALSKSSQK
jgi:hypothetical protein